LLERLEGYSDDDDFVLNKLLEFPFVVVEILWLVGEMLEEDEEDELDMHEDIELVEERESELE